MKKFIIAMLLALPMTMFAQKVGHVNSNAIMQAMPETAALQTEIQTLQKQFQDELQRKEADLKAKSEAYDKEAANLSETLKQYREQELQKAYQEYQQFGATSEQELQKVYQTKLGEIQEKVLKAVKEVGEAGGYAYVFDAASVPFIGNTANDITDQVKAKLGVK